jgi:putative component of membrane protein insertase Oxa1/YidC/SpoIIIJ protein YidD
MKYLYLTIFIVYQGIRALRYNLIQTQFGAVSHCPHTPTCGSRTLSTWQKDGFFAGLRTMITQVGSCY